MGRSWSALPITGKENKQLKRERRLGKSQAEVTLARGSISDLVIL